MSTFAPFPTRFTPGTENAKAPEVPPKAAKAPKEGGNFSHFSRFSYAEWQDPEFYPGEAPRAVEVRNLFAALSRELSRTCPEGIGQWPPLGEIDRPATDRLLDTARGYIEGTAEHEDLDAAERNLRHAWWEAAALYKQAQKQGAAMEQPA